MPAPVPRRKRCGTSFVSRSVLTVVQYRAKEPVLGVCHLSVLWFHIHWYRRGLVVLMYEYVMSALSKDEGMERIVRLGRKG